MRDKYLHIITYGCQMNKHDSQKITSLLAHYNYTSTSDAEKADLIILNTCCIREKAEHKVYSELGRLKKFKDLNPRLIIGIGGCVAQQEGERLLKHASHLDLVFGTHQIHRIPQFIARTEQGERFAQTSFSGNGEYLNLNSHPVEKGSVKSFATIMQGCNNFCSFCVVPHVRGREVSRPSNQILQEIESLFRQGVKEITLLGQNVNSYGKDLSVELSFPELISEINDIKGIERIRFVTSHPKDFSDELIASFAGLEKLCEHIHLPVQSGSNSVLKSMNRKYTREDYLEKIEKLREAKSAISITSDIIVGFPGESEKDFQDTLALLEKVEFDNLFSFKYSIRSNTKAAFLPNQVSEEIKDERLKMLHNIQAQYTLNKNKMLEGNVEKVLVEGVSKNHLERMTGRTRSNRVVNFEGNSDLRGRLVPIRIKKGFQNSLYGEIYYDI